MKGFSLHCFENVKEYWSWECIVF